MSRSYAKRVFLCKVDDEGLEYWSTTRRNPNAIEYVLRKDYDKQADEIERLTEELETAERLIVASGGQIDRLQARIDVLENDLRRATCPHSHELADWCECGWSKSAEHCNG